MNAEIYRVCADILSFAVRLPTASDLPSASDLRARAIGMLDAMVNEGRTAGVPDVELAEARYALVAFIDEQVLKSTWFGRTEWMSQPLQLINYREYTAGENFFVRLRSHLQSGARPLALEIYYLCLALGFRGAYGVTGETAAIQSYSDATRRELGKRLPSTAKFGPHALTGERVAAERKSNLLLISVIVGCSVLVLLVLIGLHFELRSEVGQALLSLSGASVQPKP
ncbi:MAG TPA: DotU family type IV/VI secretion system protein [Polyangiaceae bacterium]|nr:DotU family type IV/VI secretion system protein [Polyangiaceae bacterium]